jgi:ferredoxin
MAKITIDGQTVEIPAEATVLDAAEQLGIEIPTLCFLKGYKPATSCQVCLVRDRRTRQLVPACATRVVEGADFESETPDVHAVRRTALELLFSDHVGDCLAPCFFACPAHMDIPLMLRQIGDQDVRQAIATIKRDIAIPAILGRICPKPCEKGCRRNSADSPVAVCELKRFVADTDLASADPYLPACQADSGKRVAVIGAGPTGLAAAYYLRQAGHSCVLFEQQPAAGGRMRSGTSDEELPRDILDREIAQILRLGVELRAGQGIATGEQLDDLCATYDVVLLACGAVPQEQLVHWGLTVGPRGLKVDRESHQTERQAVFAAGSLIRGKSMVVRSAADGKEVAASIDKFLAGKPARGPGRPFSSRMGRIDPEEMTTFVAGAGPAERTTPPSGSDYTAAEASDQSHRCLACGCRAHGNCRLERYAEMYGVDTGRFGSHRRPYEVIGRDGSVMFEPGKCIKCELCVQIALRAKEPLGLSFVGRGFDVRVSVPFAGDMDDGLQKVAAECIAACPTGALAFTDQVPACAGGSCGQHDQSRSQH